MKVFVFGMAVAMVNAAFAFNVPGMVAGNQKERSISDNYVVSQAGRQDFHVLVDGVMATIVTESDDFSVCHVAAGLLADDIQRVCGMKPQITSSLKGLSGHVIYIATLGKSPLVDRLVAEKKLDVSTVTGQWETFVLQVVDRPVAGVERGLFIIGSDRRGTAFGVLDLSEKMGVSPWYWWADVPVSKRETIAVRKGRYQQGPPSVKYRGIFINDEDWGMHPWARETYAPEDEYIGPKTYRTIFELLLRLKANYIWPAMHDCTKAFHEYEENRLLADEYAIVIGSTHCEQMLRNNVWEWEHWSPADGGARGKWDWCANSQQITEYWKSRVKETAPFECIYTVGMRGIHDSGMPCSGVTDAEKALRMQDEIFPAQRRMIAEWVHPDPSTVPQIFCPYKEVLNLYHMGMEVPGDITLVWPDDNHGYIRHLSTPGEQARSGGAGIYYHVSYWGEPHDYLWLCSTPPALIWEEMKKAYDYRADRVWVLNVGDIKPAEMCTEFFLDMGWDIDRWNTNNQDEYIEQWAGREFGPVYKKQISEIMLEYYRLGQARKPEHMGWSTLYPDTPTKEPEFSPIHYNDESQQRIESYEQLESRAEKIYEFLPDAHKDAFYQLVLYPVRGACRMNQKYLFAQKSRLYAAQARTSANQYAQMAIEAHDDIIKETNRYNCLAKGKWKGMMSSSPRNLTVFERPTVATVDPVSGASMGVVLEGQINDLTSVVPLGDNAVDTLPVFDVFTKRRHFIDIFNKGDAAFAWTAVPLQPWIQLDQTAGTLDTEQRVWVRIDWDQTPVGNPQGSIQITGADKSVAVNIEVFNPVSTRPSRIDGFVQSNGYVSIEAEHYSTRISRNGVKWEVIPTLGRTGDSVTVFPTTTDSLSEISNILSQSPLLEYETYMWQTGEQNVSVYCLPTHAISSEHGLRYAIAFDDQTPQIVEYDAAEYSAQWSVNVLQGAAISKSTHTVTGTGPHTLKIWMVDPGVVMDKIVIGNAPSSYLGPPETNVKK